MTRTMVTEIATLVVGGTEIQTKHSRLPPKNHISIQCPDFTCKSILESKGGWNDNMNQEEDHHTVPGQVMLTVDHGTVMSQTDFE